MGEEKLEAISASLLEQIDILSNTASEFSSYAKFYVEEISVFNLYDVIRQQKDISGTEQYVNIGSSWYVIKSYVKDGIRVIAGLLVKTDKQVADALGMSVFNPALGISDDVDIQPVTFESCGEEILGGDGELLFIPGDGRTRHRNRRVPER